MKSPVRSPAELLAPGRALTFANVAEGAEGLVVSDLAARLPRVRSRRRSVLPWSVATARACNNWPVHWSSSHRIAGAAVSGWDCQPYDRVSPHGGILAQRLTTAGAAIAACRQRKVADRPHHGQRHRAAGCRPRETIAAQALSVAPGHVVPMDSIVRGWSTTATTAPRPCANPANTPCAVVSLDLFPAGLDQPVRFDFFGDTLESIRSFDAETSARCARHALARSWFRSRNFSW